MEGREGGEKSNPNRPNHGAHPHAREPNPSEETAKHKERNEERVNLVFRVCILACVYVFLLVLFFSCLVVSHLYCFFSPFCFLWLLLVCCMCFLDSLLFFWILIPSVGLVLFVFGFFVLLPIVIFSS